jgi:hypothetical protein
MFCFFGLMNRCFYRYNFIVDFSQCLLPKLLLLLLLEWELELELWLPNPLDDDDEEEEDGDDDDDELVALREL